MTASGRNLAARAAHWSATHRKTAIFGWLAFVVVAVLVGQMVSQKTIYGADQFNGESGRAEHALEDAGLRPNKELVLVQSQKLTIDDPEFRTAIEQTTSRLSRAEHVENVKSPLTGDAAVSADRHSALVEFEITGRRARGGGPARSQLCRGRLRSRKTTPTCASSSSAASAPTRS